MGFTFTLLPPPPPIPRHRHKVVTTCENLLSCLCIPQPWFWLCINLTACVCVFQSELVRQLMSADPQERPTTQQVLEHSLLQDLSPRRTTSRTISSSSSHSDPILHSDLWTGLLPNTAATRLLGTNSPVQTCWGKEISATRLLWTNAQVQGRFYYPPPVHFWCWTTFRHSKRTV